MSLCHSEIVIVALPPSDVVVVQQTPTSILVSWIPSSVATGYRIHYNSSEGNQGSKTVSGGFTNSYTLTSLQNGVIYTVSVLATSEHVSSESVRAPHDVGLGKSMVLCKT